MVEKRFRFGIRCTKISVTVVTDILVHKHAVSNLFFEPESPGFLGPRAGVIYADAGTAADLR